MMVLSGCVRPTVSEPAAVRLERPGCPDNACADGQVCRRRTLANGIGVTLAVDGRCPENRRRHECDAEPGKICCAEATAMIEMINYACVDVAPGCADCGCMPGDVCGAGSLQVCSYATAVEVTCGLLP